MRHVVLPCWTIKSTDTLRELTVLSTFYSRIIDRAVVSITLYYVSLSFEFSVFFFMTQQCALYSVVQTGA